MPKPAETTDDKNTGNDNASWRDSLSDDLKGDEGLKKFSSVDALATSYKELENKVGTDTVLIPTLNSSEEDVRGFLTKTGVPEKPEGYSLTPPKDGDGKAIEISDTDLATFRESAWKAGITSKRAQELLHDTYTRNKLADDQATVDQEKEVETKKEDNLRILRTAWGSAHYDNNMKIAEDSIIEFGGKDLMDMLKEKHLDTDPNILQAFAKVAKERGGDKLPDTNNSQGYITTGDLSKRKEEILSDLKGAFYNKAHADHDKMVEEFGNISKQLNEAETSA